MKQCNQTVLKSLVKIFFVDLLRVSPVRMFKKIEIRKGKGRIVYVLCSDPNCENKKQKKSLVYEYVGNEIFTDILLN